MVREMRLLNQAILARNIQKKKPVHNYQQTSGS